MDQTVGGISIMTIVTCLLVLVGAEQTLAGHLSYAAFLAAAGPLVGLTAVGRGIHFGLKQQRAEVPTHVSTEVHAPPAPHRR